MKLRTSILAALTAVSLAGVSACVVGPAPGYDVAVAPPPPQVEVAPAVRVGFVWAPGYWSWNGSRHVWVGGHYIRARPGYRWRADHWEQRGGRYHFERGHWER